jgi:hypothetical protein
LADHYGLVSSQTQYIEFTVERRIANVPGQRYRQRQPIDKTSLFGQNQPVDPLQVQSKGLRLAWSLKLWLPQISLFLSY